MRGCYKFPRVNLPYEETYDQYFETRPLILFHIYHLIARCTPYGRLPLNDRTICCIYKQDYASEQTIKIYTRKELLIMKTTISNFYTSLYIPEIQKLAFHLPHVQILGKITVVTLSKLRLNATNNFKMCYVAMIMLRGQLLVFPIK